MLDNKKILVTGGTGTVGSSLVEYILANYSPKLIRIFSRDETKQAIMKNHLKDHDLKLRFLIGDIRDKERLRRAIKKMDVVFHLAALKHVVACEYNPFEAIKTNVIGVQNLIDVSLENNIEFLVFTSTDKAASPSNTMGVSKLLGEKLVTAANYYKGESNTKFYSVRFGNVLGSRGSLIPIVEHQVMNNLPITLTHIDMTRYIMNMDKAIKFMIDTMEIAQGGEVFVLKMDIVKVIDLIDVLVSIFAEKYDKKVEQIKINEIGMFAGENLYEKLFSIEESERIYEMNDLFIILPQLTEVTTKIDLKLYPNIKKFTQDKSFISKDGPFLSKEEIKKLLLRNNLI